MSSLLLHLHRHGETTWNKQKKIIGQSTDESIEFTSHGLNQIEALKQRYSAVGLSAIYSSDLKRARLTAEIVAAQLNLPLQLSQHLRAWNMGKYQGRPMHEFLSDPEVAACFTDFTKQIPGGESIAEFHERLLSFIEMVGHHHAGDSHVLIISHSAAISNLKSVISGQAYLDVDECHLTFSPAGFNVLDNPRLEVA